MKPKHRIVLIVAALCAHLCFAPAGFSDVIQTSDIAAPQQIFQFASSAHRLDLVSFFPIVVEGKKLGALLVYDDPKTTRDGDYLELYDNSAHLVAVGWYDEFGIQR